SVVQKSELAVNNIANINRYSATLSLFLLFPTLIALIIINIRTTSTDSSIFANRDMIEIL
ncbi:TPA: hypothetical protein DEB29_04855, partial [Candidatus Wolfebacteria bacterium]|nr:hypothetical protein [Candidatus Wolfebacteria bacterium]